MKKVQFKTTLIKSTDYDSIVLERAFESKSEMISFMISFVKDPKFYPDYEINCDCLDFYTSGNRQEVLDAIINLKNI